MAKKLWSIMTDDMDSCIYSGTQPVERHHVFGGFNRKRSEEYGFVVPLSPRFHPNGVFAEQNWKEIDTELKQTCQRYYEDVLGKSREEFIQEFGRNYLDD